MIEFAGDDETLENVAFTAEVTKRLARLPLLLR